MDSITAILASRWKTLLVTFALSFLMVAWPHLGLKAPSFGYPRLLNPQPNKADIMENITPKLELIKNTFSLKKDNSIIPQAFAAGDFNQASSYVVVDFDSGKVISEKNSNTPLPIASLTKVMTAVVALDLAIADEQFKVSDYAPKVEPTAIGVVAGQKMSLEELLNALLMTSANDSAQVIKEGIDQKYGSEVFIRAMNSKAQILGLKNSHFENPQGFDGKNHVSSAEDLAILTHYALTNYPLISEIVKKDYQLLDKTQDHKQFDLYNWNGLLGVYPGAMGVKIGNTDKAGKTTIVLSERDGKKMLTVLLGAPGVLERDLWASELLDLGFNQEFAMDPVNVTEEALKAKYATWKYFN